MLPRTSLHGSRKARRGMSGHVGALSMGSLFVMLSAGTFTLFVVIGFAVWLFGQLAQSPETSMKGIAAEVPNEVLIDLLAMEVANFHRQTNEDAVSAHHISQVLFESLTGINPFDPRSMLAYEITGLGREKAVLFRKGAATEPNVYPVDHTPAREKLIPGKETASEKAPASEQQSGAESDDQAGLDPGQPVSVDDRENIRAFIYHSHNRESWVPELPGVTELSDAYDPEINITLLGKRLAERLEEEGIGTKVSDKDYPSTVQGFNYNLSYSYSLKTVQEASATYPALQYYFDIHRDSQRRDLTTVEIDGTEYAQVYFVIGHQNPNWQQNEAFAEQIHQRLEEKYPGLSRGIFGKTAQTGNGEYNQHISPFAILIEVGGPENTLEESYRTIDILAEMISDVFWDAEKVDAPAKQDVLSAFAPADANTGGHKG